MHVFVQAQLGSFMGMQRPSKSLDKTGNKWSGTIQHLYMKLSQIEKPRSIPVGKYSFTSWISLTEESIC